MSAELLSEVLKRKFEHMTEEFLYLNLSLYIFKNVNLSLWQKSFQIWIGASDNFEICIGASDKFWNANVSLAQEKFWNVNLSWEQTFER